MGYPGALFFFFFTCVLLESHNHNQDRRMGSMERIPRDTASYHIISILIVISYFLRCPRVERFVKRNRHIPFPLYQFFQDIYLKPYESVAPNLQSNSYSKELPTPIFSPSAAPKAFDQTFAPTTSSHHQHT